MTDGLAFCKDFCVAIFGRVSEEQFPYRLAETMRQKMENRPAGFRLGIKTGA